MQVLNNICFNNSYPKYNVQKKQSFKGGTNFNRYLKTTSEISLCDNYLTQLYTQNRRINFLQLKQSLIPNLELVYNKGVRGESLAIPKNAKHLQAVKNSGINTIIDLRTSDYNDNLCKKCQNLNLKYLHIPIDKSKESDRAILDNLPKLFDAIKNGKFYISCSDGKKRTDIALAINYVFNPSEKVPPYMSGHTKNNITDIADINKRLNSLFKSMTSEDRKTLGLPDDYEREFLRKKHVLKTYSEAHSKQG